MAFMFHVGFTVFPFPLTGRVLHFWILPSSRIGLSKIPQERWCWKKYLLTLLPDAEWQAAYPAQTYLTKFNWRSWISRDPAEIFWLHAQQMCSCLTISYLKCTCCLTELSIFLIQSPLLKFSEVLETKSLWFQREWRVLKVSTWESLNLERPSFSASIFHLKVCVVQYLGMVLSSHLGHVAVRSLVQSLLEVHGSLPKNRDGQFLSLSISKGSKHNQYDKLKNTSHPTALCACLSLMMCF